MDTISFNKFRYSEFSSLHPLVIAAFFLVGCSVVMVCSSPVVLLTAFFSGLLYLTYLKGISSFFPQALSGVCIIFVMAVINGFFTHDGNTVLFYLNANRITLEGFLFGANAGAMLSSVVYLMQILSAMLTSDKIIYLFGRVVPSVGLLISMVFRSIPLLRDRFFQIHSAQRGIGKTTHGFFSNIRLRTKEFSILTAWSLESSIETSDSMAARGYGLKGRTSFHLFRFSSRDKYLLAFFLVVGILFAAGIACGFTTVYFYPDFRMIAPFHMQLLFAAGFGAFLLTPFIIDLIGDRKWKKFDLMG